MQGKEQLTELENYYFYTDLVETDTCTVYTKDIDKYNWKLHYLGILNILKDGIETEYVTAMKIHVIFTDGIDCYLMIHEYYNTLVMWNLILQTDTQISSAHLFWDEDFLADNIKEYIDEVFLDEYRTMYTNKMLNNIIADTLEPFKDIDKFSLWIMNTFNLKDTIDLMNENPRFDELLHLDLSNVIMDDIKERGMQATNEAIDIIKNTDYHCLCDSFRTHEATNPKQFKEIYIHMGNIPNGEGGVFPATINSSLANGGLNNPIYNIMEDSSGRNAQIIAKTNVGTSGAFARILGLNNSNTIINSDPNYACNTRHKLKITISNMTILKMYNNRYYSLTPDGIEYKLKSKRDLHLIGQTVYFRSPCKCQSLSKGKCICFRCYGDLAFTNIDINPGKMAAELLSSRFTQKMLSAKHLLEEQIRKMQWSSEFFKLFDIQFNVITLLDTEDTNYYKGYKLIIYPDQIQFQDELDDFDYNEYITSFDVQFPNGTKYTINTNYNDEIYISPELKEFLWDDKSISEEERSEIVIDMNKLTDMGAIFLINITNNELSDSLKEIMTVINKKDITETKTVDDLVQLFIDKILTSGISINAVHLEIMIANQIRDDEDVLELADWSLRNEHYKLLTLSHALEWNPSVTVSLNYQNVAKMLYSPITYKKHKPSIYDLVCMEQPQIFLNDDIVDHSNSYISDKDEIKDAVTIEYTGEE